MKKPWTPFVLLAIAAGCGPPVVYDTAGRPVEDPVLMAQVNGLWLAVDSSEAGIRAVLELQVAAPEGTARTWSARGLKLWTGSGPPISPVRLRQGSVRCWPSSPRVAPCPSEVGEGRGCTWQLQGWESECYYTLCAEFALERVPVVTEPLVLNLEGTLAVLQLAAVR